MEDIEVLVKYYVKEEDLQWSDIVFFNRMMPHDLDEILRLRKKHSFKLVCDFDDHYKLDKDHYLTDHYNKFDISKTLERWIRVSDCITVTHERLLRVMQPLNKNIHILPNAIAKTDQFLVKKVADEFTRLFWAGSPTHKRDLQLMRRAFELIDKTTVKFIMGGFNKAEAEWTDMANLYTNNGRWPHQVIDHLGVHEYYKMYALCDIALVPLVDNEFNRNKSNLKVLEAGNIEAPVIVSRVDPYLGFPESIVNYVDGNNTFYSQITRLLKNKGLCKEQGVELRNYCDKHYNFLKINKERKQIFDHVAAKQSIPGKVSVDSSQ